MYETSMNQQDINYIVQLLSKAIQHQDWEAVEEALEYTTEFQDEPTQFEEE
jgi:hypothetical protein